jgi:localization factor PodJL
MLAEIRAELPEQQAQALSRIEQGIGRLARRMSALGWEGRREGAAMPPPPSSWRLAPSGEEPWDPQSAEELMRIYEAMHAQSAGADQEAQERRQPQCQPHCQPQCQSQWSREGLAATPAPEPQPRDAAWLERRLGELAALFERSLAENRSAEALADLDRRLEQFERRLDNALSDMAHGIGRGDLKLIDAHLLELAGHFEAVHQQLGRLDALDTQLRELAQALAHAEPPSAVDGSRGEGAVAELIERAAERAASRVAQYLPGIEGARDRIEALEALIRDHLAQRGAGEGSGEGLVCRIENALMRIAERVEAIHSLTGAPAAGAGHASERDGLELEHDRLAEAYAEGVRVLGQTSLEPTLDAADYVVGERPDERGTRSDPAAELGADDWAGQEETERQDLRDSALRAALRAQAVAHSPAADGPDGDPAQSLALARVKTSAPTKAGSYRASLLLAGAMALLFGSGFMAVDSMLATPAPAGARRPEPGSRPQTGANDADVPPRPGAGEGQSAPTPQPPSPTPMPDGAGEEASQSQSVPTRHLYRLLTEATAEPLPPSEAESAGSSPVLGPGRGAETDADTGADSLVTTMPAHLTGSARGIDLGIAQRTVGPALGAAGGEADGEVELAKRFEQHARTPQDPRQAFLWYERAASQGQAAAQFRLAVLFERGIGVSPDPERAKVWYGRAAEQGHVRAMHNLGVMLVAGEPPADPAGAARWFGQAAERGFVDSQFNLAVLYESGRGVARNLEEAYLWFALAARSGDLAAARHLEQVAAQLHPTEVAAAEAKLAVWRPVALKAANPSRTGPSYD